MLKPSPHMMQTVECDAVPAAAILTAADSCGTATVTSSDSKTGGACGSRYIITRTWTATDACGNTATATQTITVQDTVAPVLIAVPVSVVSQQLPSRLQS